MPSSADGHFHSSLNRSPGNSVGLRKRFVVDEGVDCVTVGSNPSCSEI